MSVYTGESSFGEFEVRRCGLRYRVVQNCKDGIVRDLFLGKFWRWITAARIAQALWLAQIDAERRAEGEHKP